MSNDDDDDSNDNDNDNQHKYYNDKPVPVAARSKTQVFGRSPAEIVGLNPNGGMDVCLL